jgi:hypothetical protein
MPRVKQTAPSPTREKGQRSLDPENAFLWRLLPAWLRPQWYNAEMWRAFVLQQPVAMNCRESLISPLSALDWKIDARDSKQRDELKSEIDYYTRFFENTGDMDFIELIEWISQDYLDLPFGAGIEVGREGDDENGRVVWIEPLDGGTLFPTLNDDWPVGQITKYDPTKAVYFPKYAINRLYMSPRTTIERRGWGMSPPEKIYLAMELLNRGDKYYAHLLLDTPEAGILDLMDMDKTSAEEWVQAFKSLLGGIDPFKIPILYEHTSEAKFIPFGRSPTELLFNQVTTKYATLVAAGYNVSLSDIGYPTMGNGGETLAGSIRQERRTRKTGFARITKKTVYFFNRMLPPELKFSWIDPDDELSVAMGRARLASLTAFGAAIDKRIFTPKEARLQLIADGLVNISIPEEILEDEFDVLPVPTSPFGGTTAKKPGMLGTQVPPSLGGQGEIKSRFEDEIELGIHRALESLESGSDKFIFLPDADAIANEFAELISDENRRENVKEQISDYVKNTTPEKFAETYEKILPYLELEDNEKIADSVSQELNNLRYNLFEDFTAEVTNIVKG